MSHVADKTPNYQLEQIRLQDAIAQQERAVRACATTIMEAIDRIETAMDNRAAHLRAIEGYQKKLAGLEAEHGKFTEEDVLKLAGSYQRHGEAKGE